MQDNTFDDEDRYDPTAPAPPSKSQRKREATASQEIGEHLVRLTSAQLKQIPLPDELLAPPSPEAPAGPPKPAPMSKPDCFRASMSDSKPDVCFTASLSVFPRY